MSRPFTFSNSIELDFLLGTEEEWDAFLKNKFNAPLTRQRGKEREWPSDVRGSISHCKISDDLTLFVLASGKAKNSQSVGVDIEPIIKNEIANEIMGLIATKEEFQILKNNIEVEEATLTSILFSSKEALYKMVNPIENFFFDFLDAILVRAKILNNFISLEFKVNSLSDTFTVHCELRILKDELYILSLAKK